MTAFYFFDIFLFYKMVSIETFKQIALAFEATEERPHFNRTAFKIIGKRIFATLHEESESGNILLSKTDQQIYCSFDENAVYPVPNKFGLHGWTTFELQIVPVELISDALLSAYKNVISTRKKK
jgi:hypothetical protein